MNNKIAKQVQRLSLTSMIIVTLTIGIASPIPAFAAEGDIIATVICANANPGVGLAFDGARFYYPLGLESFTLGTCNTTGVVGVDIPIIGLNDAISTVAYDVNRDLLWAATSDLGGEMRDIYQIDKVTGQSTFQFTAFATGGSLTDGLAYDGQDDTIWVTGDVSSVISHYTTGGAVIATDIPIPPTSLGILSVSGVAAGVDVLYLGHDGNTVITKHAKSDLSLLSEFDTGGLGRTEDLECDPDTFPGIDVVWSKDAFSTSLEAFEVADGTCPLGGGGEMVSIAQHSFSQAFSLVQCGCYQP